MKNKLLLIYLLFYLVNSSSGQINGPDTVCTGYIYTYNANILGADSLSWTFPIGWHQLSSSGTQVDVLCNKNIGQICVIGFDSLGNNVGQQCLTVVWGGSGAGWHVQSQQIIPGPCQCPPFTASVIPNAGTGCGICTAGILSPNLRYAIYRYPWPTTFSQFVTYADGTSQINLQPNVSVTYYVYLVDITFGIQNAILIEGGLCSPVVNNTFTLPACVYANLGIAATPNPVCVGDTLTLQYNYNFGNYSNYSWSTTLGNATFLPPNGLDHIQCIVNSAGPLQIFLVCYNINCVYSGYLDMNSNICNPALPAASFQSNSSGLCPGSCINFVNTSINATSYQWLFPGGTPASDTAIDPQNICYFNSGTYDVTLIAGNAAGTDTMILPNLITVYPPISFSPITQIGDTLFSTPGLASYQWYSDTILIPGADDYYYIASQNGNYSVITTDINGCNATAYITNVIASAIYPPAFSNEMQAYSFNGKIYLDAHSSKSFSSIIQIFDVMGKEVFNECINILDGKNIIDLPYKNISPGIYYIKVQKFDQVTTFKVFI